MMLGRIRNVISLRTRNVSRRIQKALQELSESLSNQPEPVPVRVPVRNRSGQRFQRFQACVMTRRCFSSFTGGSTGSWPFNHFTNMNNCRTNFFTKLKMFARFYNTPKPANASKIFQAFGHGSMFHNFSQTYQNTYRMKLHLPKFKFSYKPMLVTQLKQQFGMLDSKDVVKTRFAPFSPKLKHPSIKLNLSLSSTQHHLTLNLARTESSATHQEKQELNQEIHYGSYIEFPITFNLNIPHETLLSEEILDEMLFSVKVFEQKLRSFKQDLTNLFELGELPIKYIPQRNVLRVYFANCDCAKLEALCREKNITGGVIYEDIPENEALAASESVYTSAANTAAAPRPTSANTASYSSSSSIDQNDILSSLFNSDESYTTPSETQDSELFSELLDALPNDAIVRLTEEPQTNVYPTIISDELYWISA